MQAPVKSPASHHHKEVLKYGSKPQATSGKYLKVSSRNELTSSKSSLINSELPLLESSKTSRLNLQIGNKFDSSPVLPIRETFPSINNNSRSQLPLLESSKTSRLNLQIGNKFDSSPVLPIRETFPSINNNSRSQVSLSNNNKDEEPVTILPLTPSEALRLYGNRLTEYEKTELEKYPKIWYLGLDACKIHGEHGGSQNGGFDDDSGSYNKVLHDHIGYRYEILEVIGKGSFGQVIRALDHMTNQHVAIKIIRNKKRFHHQALVEVRILDHLRKRDKEGLHNVIHMQEYFYFRNHLCISFELMSLNLYELIKKNNYQGFSLNLIRRFANSLLKCLRLLQKENIIHCDLKPENVLLKQRARLHLHTVEILSFTRSYFRSDVWNSNRHVEPRLYSSRIIYRLSFIPRFENEVEQLACLMEVLGPPPDEIIAAATRRRLFFDSRGNPRYANDQLFIDFISRCLEWNPKRRMTPEEALRHEWIQSASSTHRTNDLRHSQSEASVSHDSFSHSSSRTSGSSFSRPHKCAAPKTSDKIKAKIVDTRPNDSTSVDSNLNDSGYKKETKYLPILSYPSSVDKECKYVKQKCKLMNIYIEC
ncbi:Protein kinase domain [Popillia japonica]|uniref:dual-specificity kinase n=2 Tax=Popillia japonica TaxID=7064 RepID=A0AAW1IS93_POPJA